MEVESGYFFEKNKKVSGSGKWKAKKWIILANIFENFIFEKLFVAAIAVLFEIFPNPCALFYVFAENGPQSGDFGDSRLESL